MADDRWNQVKSLFQAALDQPATDRAGFLADQCGDATIRAEVDRLLAMHEHSTGFLQTPINAVFGRVTGADPMIGVRLDGFTILRRIGAGGMGAVYEAQQSQPDRRAAVKVLRPEFATPTMLRRFAYESEVLARLQHPGIASVYAAGTFDLGNGAQPWFAMELIEGQPLNAFVKDHPLSVEHKLQLLVMLCDAVQHAHQRGVIHRDLKPANVLVTNEKSEVSGQKSDGSDRMKSDGRLPTFSVKILDFGVARVIDPEQHVTMHTAVGELVGTLWYMSPEQIAGNPNDIDARCDVYALGVIGFEMLAGRRPHDRRSATSGPGGAVASAVRAIEHEEPTRLGAVVPSMRGDLETIFAKAMEKQPQRRYQSAEAFAADVRRFLNHEPVLARPATALYQMRKFARRHRAIVGGIAATIIALSIGVILYAGEAHRAREQAARSDYEAEKAVAINNFITNDFLMKLLAASAQRSAVSGQKSEGAAGQTSDFRLLTSDLVDQATENVGAMFADQPLAEAAVRNEIATIYYNLGAFDKAAEQFKIALAKWEANLGPDHPDTLKAVNNLGQSFANLRQRDEAEALFRRGLEGRLRVLGEDDPFTLVSMNNLANLLRYSGKLDEAEPMLRRTLAAQRRVLGDSHKSTLITMANLGSVLIARDHVDEALVLHRQAYESACRTLGDDHVTALMAGMRLGQTLHKAKLDEEGRTLLRAVTAAFERTMGANSKDTITARRALSRCCISLGKKDEAREQLQLAMDAAGTRADPPEAKAELLKEIQQELDALVAPDTPKP